MNRQLFAVALTNVLLIGFSRPTYPQTIDLDSGVSGFFGFDIAGVPDINGDGTDDYAVAARDETVNGFAEAGRVYLYDGVSGGFLRSITSPNVEEMGWFGFSVTGFADINGNGAGEVVVGAKDEDESGFSAAGHVYVFDGSTGALIRTLITPNLQNFANLGTDVSPVPDVNGDGIPDLIAGAEQESPSSQNAAGRAYLFDLTDGSVIHTLVSPDLVAGALFGRSVSGIPDVNGDGRGDVIVGQGTLGPHRAYIFSGSTGTLLHTLSSPNEPDAGSFGARLDGIPDINGDGFGDVLVGASAETVMSQSAAGRAYAFSGNTGGLLYSFESPNPTSPGSFGRDVAEVPDVTGDGAYDVVVTADEEPGDTPPKGGIAYVFDGATGLLDSSFVSPNGSGGSMFGNRVLGITDNNGDGLGEIFVGAAWEGRAYVFRSDVVAPELNVIGDNPANVECGTVYVDEGATASDNADGDITGDIVVVSTVDSDSPGAYAVTYNVTDSAGNAATEVARTVNVVDTTGPVITLLGSDPVNISVGTPYVDAGATAVDACEGDLTPSIVVNNPVDTGTPGAYVITYNVSDSVGNDAVEVTRTVNVGVDPGDDCTSFFAVDSGSTSPWPGPLSEEFEAGTLANVANASGTPDGATADGVTTDVVGTANAYAFGHRFFTGTAPSEQPSISLITIRVTYRTTSEGIFAIGSWNAAEGNSRVLTNALVNGETVGFDSMYEIEADAFPLLDTSGNLATVDLVFPTSLIRSRGPIQRYFDNGGTGVAGEFRAGIVFTDLAGLGGRSQPNFDLHVDGIEMIVCHTPGGDGTIDFDPVFVPPLSLNGDLNGPAPHPSPNGILDSDELALLAAVLNDPSLNLSATGGITHAAALAVWTANYAQAQSDLAPYVGANPLLDLGFAGYATLGDSDSFDASEAFMTAVLGVPGGTVNSGNYDASLAGFLSFSGDADGDGATNLAEFQSIPPGADRRALYIAAALDPGITPSPAPIDFDPVFVLPLSLSDDGNGPAPHPSPNGIVDSDELALLAFVLNNPPVDLSVTGGVTHAAAITVWNANYAQAQADLAPYVASHPMLDIGFAGFATLGDADSFNASAAFMTAILGVPAGAVDAADYDQSLLGWMNHTGDADGDGFTNVEEYEAIPAGPDRRALYIAAALDPGNTPSSGGVCDNSLVTPCPNFDAEGVLVYNVAGLGNWFSADADNNGMRDSWEVHVFAFFLCQQFPPFGAEALCVFETNLETFRQEPLYESFFGGSVAENVLAALLSLSGAWRDFLTNEGLIEGVYQPFTFNLGGAKLASAETFSAAGDIDGEGLTNKQEYDNVVSVGGTRNMYLEAVMNPNLIGNDFNVPASDPIALALAVLVIALLIARQGRYGKSRR